MEFIANIRADSNGIRYMAGTDQYTGTPNIPTISNTETKFSSYSIYCPDKGYSFIKQDSIVNSLCVGNTEWTFSCWANLTGVNNYPIFSLSDSDGYIRLALVVPNAVSHSGYIYVYADGFSPTIVHNYGENDVYDGNWHHFAMTRDSQGTIMGFFDGVLCSIISSYTKTYGESPSYGFGQYPSFTSGSLVGYFDDIVLVKDVCMWDDDFTPPTNYLFPMNPYVYLSSNSLYKESSGSLSLITNDWSGATSLQKESYIEQGNRELASPQLLESIMPYKIITTEDSTIRLNGIPETQILTPTSLINTASLDSLTDITVNGTVTNGSVKIAITTDLTTYKKYDPVQEEWVTCTDDDGMDISEVNALTAEILSDIDISEGIAFKIIFVSNNDSVNIELTGISTVGNIDGSWSQSVHGTDYDVSYPNKTTMAVTLKTNGDYIINYPISLNS